MSGTDTDFERHVRFDSVFNFRDLGGYPATDRRTVKWRTLFRADGVHRLSIHDLTSVGVRTVLDLRTHDEIERGRFTHESVGFHHLPIIQRPWSEQGFEGELDPVIFLSDRYADMLTEGAESIAAALHIISEADALPLVFHCAAGKDRTGVVAAVVLSLLGVSDDDIATDYSLSRLGMDRFKAWIIENYPDAADAMTKQPDAFLAAPADAMHTFLERVRREHGSMIEYVDGLGVSNAAVEAVRSNLLN